MDLQSNGQQQEYFETGIAWLDLALGGGFVAGDFSRYLTISIDGITGTGKTLLALHLAAQAAVRWTGFGFYFSQKESNDRLYFKAKNYWPKIYSNNAPLEYISQDIKDRKHSGSGSLFFPLLEEPTAEEFFYKLNKFLDSSIIKGPICVVLDDLFPFNKRELNYFINNNIKEADRRFSGLELVLIIVSNETDNNLINEFSDIWVRLGIENETGSRFLEIRKSRHQGSKLGKKFFSIDSNDYGFVFRQTPPLAARTTEGLIPAQPIWSTRDFRTNNTLAFMLMPFANRTNEEKLIQEVYQDHVKPVIENFGMKCIRADDIFGPTPVMEDIWRSLCSSLLVVADVTGRNPNVFYELGIAHTLGRPAVLITQSEDDVPFDIRSFRYLKYGSLRRDRERFENELNQTLATVLGRLPHKADS